MFDKVIKNVRIIDGSAAPWYRGDIGIQDGRNSAKSDVSHKKKTPLTAGICTQRRALSTFTRIATRL